MLASHGFVVAVPEIYHELEPAGTVLAYDEAGAELGNRHKITKTLSSYDADACAALEFLKSSPHCTGKLGAMGICLGGHLAFRKEIKVSGIVFLISCCCPLRPRNRRRSRSSARTVPSDCE